MRIVIFALILLAALAALMAWTRTQTAPQPSVGTPPSENPSSIYLGLRQQILEMKRAKAGLPEPRSSSEPWGVVVDWGVPSGTATIVALSDGTASVYLSGGGGYLGGQGHPPIRAAAENWVAAEPGVQWQATKTFPLPRADEMRFFVLTDGGVLTANAPVDELQSGRPPLSRLAEAAQMVIT